MKTRNTIGPGAILLALVGFGAVVTVREERAAMANRRAYVLETCASLINDEDWPIIRLSLAREGVTSKEYCVQQLLAWEGSVIEPPILPCTVDGLAAFCTRLDAVTIVYEPARLGEISTIVEDDHQDPSPTIIMLGSANPRAGEAYQE